MVLSIIFMVRNSVKKLQILRTAFFLILCAASMHADTLFNTIDELRAYANSHPTSVPISNQDYLNPDYTKFFESFVPDAWDKMLMTLRLKSRSLWQPKPFIELLKRLTESRKKDGMHGEFLQRKEVSQDDHFLIWGNLQGAFHSLVYTLEHLIEQKILDKNLKIIAPKYFMVFSGNVVNRSPYSLETLTVVLRLMEENPGRVFYIKGNQEMNGFWQDYDMQDEWEAKVAQTQGFFPPYPESVVPFVSDVNAFFDTLPVVLYLGMRTVDSSDGIRIGHFGRNIFRIESNEVTYALNAIDQTVIPLPIKITPQDDVKPATLVAMTEGSCDLIPNYNSEGLRLLPPDEGITAWSVLSAATECFEKLYQFMTDSYVDITIALPMKKSSITQYYQDIKNRSGFKTGRVYNMYSGQSDEQFRAQSKVDLLCVGATIDLEAEAAILGVQIRNGMSLAINKQNTQGIVPGLFMSLAILNDRHRFVKIRSNIETLLDQYQTTMLLGIEANVMARDYFDLVTKNNLLVLFPFTAVTKFHSAEYPNIIHFGPSYTEEAYIATKYILDKIAPDNIAIFYEKGQMGEDAFIGAKEAFKEKGFTKFIEIPFKSNLLDFKEQLATIQHENPEAIALFSSSAIGQEFIRQVGVQNLSQRTLYGLSSFGAETFRRYYKGRGLQIITANLVPDPFTSDLPIVQEFKKEAAANNISVSPQCLEAYINASIFVEAVRLIKGPINNESIKRSLESMKNYDFKGLKLTFNPATRELSNMVWLDLGDGSPWKPFTVRNNQAAVDAKVIKKNQTAAVVMPEQKETAFNQKIMEELNQLELENK
jgi:ABC-type branched-subunit amino acid transport system substrate-binding protein